MRYLIALALLCLLCAANAQSKTEKISKKLTFEKVGPQNTLIVANINGSIEVEGYNGSEVLIEVEKKVTGKTQARFDKGWNEIQLGVMDRADTLILYVKGVCPVFGRTSGKHGRKDPYSYEWNDCDRDESEQYDFWMNFKIKIPSTTNIRVSTINEGEVKISNTSALVDANNINGGITLSQISNAAKANTINGDVDVTYVQNPRSDCRFYTLNGDINAYFKKGLSSNVSFKSFNGEFFTNIAKIESMPTEVEKEKSAQGVKYKINGNKFQTGSGGANLDFETFNGNVYLREQ